MKSYIDRWHPEEVDDVWRAVGKYRSNITGNTHTVHFFDYNGKKLDLIDKQFAIDWCDTRNEIELIL